jgi:hypothetical protein
MLAATAVPVWSVHDPMPCTAASVVASLPIDMQDTVDAEYRRQDDWLRSRRRFHASL